MKTEDRIVQVPATPCSWQTLVRWISWHVAGRFLKRSLYYPKRIISMKRSTIFGAVFIALSSGPVQATLFDRGGGLLYDDVLNVTWLQDANYAFTSGYAGTHGEAYKGFYGDGRMPWDTATSWAASLVYHDSVRNADYSDWRLASNTPVNGVAWNYNYADNGSTDFGFNITSPHSELSYMYYINLGLKGAYSPTGSRQLDSGVYGDGTYGGQSDVGLVHNLQASTYWSGTLWAPDNNAALFFYIGNNNAGYQVMTHMSNELFAWAVRDGDVAAAVPEPETYALFMAGLGLMGFIARRRKNGQA